MRKLPDFDGDRVAGIRIGTEYPQRLHKVIQNCLRVKKEERPDTLTVLRKATENARSGSLKPTFLKTLPETTGPEVLESRYPIVAPSDTIFGHKWKPQDQGKIASLCKSVSLLYNNIWVERLCKESYVLSQILTDKHPNIIGGAHKNINYDEGRHELRLCVEYCWGSSLGKIIDGSNQRYYFPCILRKVLKKS